MIKGKRKRIAIVGAGIGGLTVAIALQRKGYTVSVYENAPLIKPLGAGLGLGANAIKAYHEIGIHKEIIKAGKVIKQFSIKDRSGKILALTDSEKLSAKYGEVSNFAIHRADLHHALLNHLDKETVKLGKGCIDFKHLHGHIRLIFSDGSFADADAVIAADGIHSVFRKKLLPHTTPRYAGYTCWRAVVDNIPDNLNTEETTEIWGAGCRFGIVPLAGEKVYWFACVNAKRNDKTMQSFEIKDLLSYFGEFHSSVLDLLAHTRNDQLIWGDILDIEPLKRFAFGNIVLMGDAAHATTPNMGQGACMAIEDAAVLATCMERYETVEEAFRQFEDKRIARTTKIVNDSWTFGRIAQLENAVLSWLRNTAIRLTPSSVTEKQMKFLYDVSFH